MARRTEFLAGTLDLMLLQLLQSGPANGWDLTQRIRAVSRDALELKYGTLYPALHRLESGGLIRAKWGTSDQNRRARFYALTAAGRKRLEVERREWRTFASLVEAVLRTGSAT
jgi:transcriptional regulator